jgi:hypothetical protein
MNGDAAEFSRRAIAILERFFRQNGEALPATAGAEVAARLYSLVRERGLPPPLPAGEMGEPGGMADGEVGPLVARVLGPAGHPLLADAAKQLVKACFYPEFKVCRDSYREVTVEGACKRQQLKRVRGRTSGAHCIDCPYWVSLPPDAHATLLAREWKGDVAEFHTHRDMFLPEDFRAFRRWLHAAARSG